MKKWKGRGLLICCGIWLLMTMGIGCSSQPSGSGIQLIGKEVKFTCQDGEPLLHGQLVRDCSVCERLVGCSGFKSDSLRYCTYKCSYSYDEGVTTTCCQGKCTKCGSIAIHIKNETERCKRLAGCQSRGECTYNGKRCHAGSREDCLQSEGCKKDGKCSPVKGSCIAASDDDCALGERCKKYGECRASSESCSLLFCHKHCDCPQGFSCSKVGSYGLICAPTKEKVYCCDKPGCPKGKACYKKNRSRGTCEEK